MKMAYCGYSNCSGSLRASLLLLLLSAAGAARFSRASVLKGAAACTVGAAACAEAYARYPAWSAESLPLLLSRADAKLERLVLVLPGAGGPDANTAQIMAALSRALAPRGCRVMEYDWSDLVGDQLQAPHNA